MLEKVYSDHCMDEYKLYGYSVAVIDLGGGRKKITIAPTPETEAKFYPTFYPYSDGTIKLSFPSVGPENLDKVAEGIQVARAFLEEFHREFDHVFAANRALKK